jgi:hypothetical protein
MNLNTRFLITTAAGVVLATAAFAQSPSGSSSSTTQPSATQPSTTSPSTSTRQPSTSTTQQPAATAPSGTSAQSAPPANANTTQNQPPATSGTAQTQPQSTSPSTAQSPPSTQQPATNQAQTPAQTNQTQTPAQTNQAQTPAQSNQPATNRAQSPAPTNQPATNNAQAPSSNTNVTASANIGVQEQTRISQSIARLNVRPLTNVNFSVAVGTAIPRNVRLQPLPADIVQIVPQYRGYNFVVVRDEIVIIEPSSYRIVAVMPRSGGRAAAAPPPTQKKVKFSNRERDVIRSHMRTSRQSTTTGSAARAQMRVGDQVPDSVELREFPSTVYRTVPTVREYRYIDMDNRSYLIEPRGRMIIEEID